MSKQNPNQNFYKTAGRGQSEGPDRVESNLQDDKERLAQKERSVANAKHPAVMRSKRK